MERGILTYWGIKKARGQSWQYDAETRNYLYYKRLREKRQG